MHLEEGEHDLPYRDQEAIGFHEWMTPPHSIAHKKVCQSFPGKVKVCSEVEFGLEGG
jgi:hypothetical protein